MDQRGKNITSRPRHQVTLRLLDPKPVRVIPLVTKQRLQIGNQRHTIWFPPENLWDRASLRSGMTFKQGEDLIRLKVTSGDHLFVDRLTYNFRRPTRGETIVFKSTGVKS